MAEIIAGDLFRVSTPRGLVPAGWRLVNGKSTSNIMCVLCLKDEKRLHCVETVEELVRHIVEKHSEIAFFLGLKNWRQMIF